MDISNFYLKDKEVIVEELLEDDFDNTMPPLEALSSPLYLSHTVPPFIYQYVEDQVKIIQVLGNYPLTDKKLVMNVESDINSHIESVESKNLDENTEKNIIDLSRDLKHNKSPNDEVATITNVPDVDNRQSKSEAVFPTSQISTDEVKRESTPEKFLDTESVTTVYDNDSDSDNEASYGTPEPMPKLNKKLSKGKYGKSKAPLPPIQNDIETESNIEVDNNTSKNLYIKEHNPKEMEQNEVDVSVNADFNKDNLNLEVKDRRSKSKSPARSSNLGFGKLLQFPSKLAFWAKGDEKSNSDLSINSKSTDKLNNDIQSCDIANSSKDSTELENDSNDTFIQENITHDINEKSDELLKLIDAKLETHPEYKMIPLNDVITSKSTDV